jgi:hypothetical protein
LPELDKTIVVADADKDEPSIAVALSRTSTSEAAESTAAGYFTCPGWSWPKMETGIKSRIKRVKYRTSNLL